MISSNPCVAPVANMSIAGFGKIDMVLNYLKVKPTSKRPVGLLKTTCAIDPNRTRTDNYLHKGNTNPYSGRRGTKN